MIQRLFKEAFSSLTSQNYDSELDYRNAVLYIITFMIYDFFTFLASSHYHAALHLNWAPWLLLMPHFSSRATLLHYYRHTESWTAEIYSSDEESIDELVVLSLLDVWHQCYLLPTGKYKESKWHSIFESSYCCTECIVGYLNPFMN